MDQIFWIVALTCELCKVNPAEFFTLQSLTAVSQSVFKPGKDTSQSQKPPAWQELTKKNTLLKGICCNSRKIISMSFCFCRSLKESIRECTSR